MVSYLPINTAVFRVFTRAGEEKRLSFFTFGNESRCPFQDPQY